jgi:3,4-dihydroxy 2-butanone 4-phosphate synthase / GTP cyclohydrolase II
MEEMMDQITDLLKNFSKGEIAVVFDDEDRENEADLIVSIEKLTPEKVNFLATYGKGLICTALSEEIIRDKGFPLMPSNRKDPHSTAFTLSVDSISTKTGISPYERYITAKDLIDPKKINKDFITPGHMFPLLAKNGGLLERRGHTEAAVTLCKLSGLIEAALICEMVGNDGKMISKKEAFDFAKQHNLSFCSIEEMVEYQKLNFLNVEKIAKAKLPTEYGLFDITIYKELYQNKEHIFLSMGDFTEGVVRIHSECLTGDVFSSRTCDCGTQLKNSLIRISEDKKGAIIYLRQEGRGIGLSEKIKAYDLQQTKGFDTVDANLELGHKVDYRDYHQAAWILKEEGFKYVKLITNNPQKTECLQKHGLNVIVETMKSYAVPENLKYLKTKKDKLGHNIKI